MNEAKTAGSLWRCLETAGISAGGVALSIQLGTSGGVWRSERALVWLAALPVLCGAQHGTLHGIASALLLTGTAMVLGGPGVGSASSELSDWMATPIALIAVGALAGLFRDDAQRRHAALAQAARTLTQQLRSAKNALRTLRLSHAQLEEQLQTQCASLAGALGDAAEQMGRAPSQRALGTLLLEVLAAQASVQSATLFAVRDEHVLPEPLAAIGAGSDRDDRGHGHALVLRAVSTRKLTAVVDGAARARAARTDKGVLAAVPLVTSAGHLVGVIAIHKLPFHAFHTEQLRKLYVIATHLVDWLEQRRAELAPARDPAATTTVPDQPDSLSAQARRQARRVDGEPERPTSKPLVGWT